jgi:hypothetical protein
VVYDINFTSLPSTESLKPKLENVETHFILSIEHLERLMKEGYDFDFYSDLDIDKNMLNNGAILVGVFVNKEMAYRGWLALNKESAYMLAPYLSKIEFVDQSISEKSATNPEYQGKGIFTFAFAQKCAYAQQSGKPKLQGSVDKGNLAVHKVMEKLGGRIVYSGHHIRLLYLWDFYRLRPVTKQ